MQSCVMYSRYVLNIWWALYYGLPTNERAFCESERTLKMLILRLQCFA